MNAREEDSPHWASLTAPVTSVVLSSGQSVHGPLPSDGLNVPVPHMTHAFPWRVKPSSHTEGSKQRNNRHVHKYHVEIFYNAPKTCEKL